MENQAASSLETMVYLRTRLLFPWRAAAALGYGKRCSSGRRRCPLMATAPSTSAETLGRALEE
jgi:hypothetical protein